MVSETEIKNKAFHAIFFLATRQLVVQGVNVGLNILLARLLGAKEFGFYGTTISIFSFLLLIVDLGLNTSLVRQKKEPSDFDYNAILTWQLVIVSFVAVASIICATIVGIFNVNIEQFAFFFFWGPVYLLMSVMQLGSMARLERKLEFSKVASIEILQALTYGLILLIGILSKIGPISFFIAMTGRSLVGLTAFYFISKPKFKILWDFKNIKQHLSFGFAYQSASIVSLVKDSIIPIVVGGLGGLAQVGYVNWAQMVASYPVLVLMAFQRIYIPSFARMAAHPAQLGNFVEKIIFLTNSVVAPLATISLLLFQPMVVLIFGAKWLVAAPIFYLLWLSNLFVPTSTPLIGLLNALGDSKTSLKFALLWMIMTWALGLPMILIFGTIGFGIANCIVQLSNILLYRVAQKRVDFKILPSIYSAWLASFAALIPFFLFMNLIKANFTSIVIVSILYFCSYFAFLLWFRADIRSKILYVVGILRKKK